MNARRNGNRQGRTEKITRPEHDDKRRVGNGIKRNRNENEEKDTGPRETITSETTSKRDSTQTRQNKTKTNPKTDARHPIPYRSDHLRERVANLEVGLESPGGTSPVLGRPSGRSRVVRGSQCGGGREGGWERQRFPGRRTRKAKGLRV